MPFVKGRKDSTKGTIEPCYLLVYCIAIIKCKNGLQNVYKAALVDRVKFFGHQ